MPPPPSSSTPQRRMISCFRAKKTSERPAGFSLGSEILPLAVTCMNTPRSPAGFSSQNALSQMFVRVFFSRNRLSLSPTRLSKKDKQTPQLLIFDISHSDAKQTPPHSVLDFHVQTAFLIMHLNRKKCVY